jgi:4-hydroxyphenylpyruvate dioxygenase
MDVLSWSRHHRLFPGEGSSDLGEFAGRVVAAGYRGPLSLEVFNDTFGQTDTARTGHFRRGAGAGRCRPAAACGVLLS